MSEKKFILAFDQSVKRSGWCLYQPHHVETMLFGHFDSAPDKEMSIIEKETRFADAIIKLFDDHKPDFVAWEAAAPDIRVMEGGHVNASQLILHGLQGEILMLCRERGIPCMAVHPKSWRAKILENGNLKKEEAKRKAVYTCRTILHIDVKNHDQAEAACIAIHASHSDLFRKVQAGLIPAARAA